MRVTVVFYVPFLPLNSFGLDIIVIACKAHE